jgi:hypothetical protein
MAVFTSVETWLGSPSGSHVAPGGKSGNLNGFRLAYPVAVQKDAAGDILAQKKLLDGRPRSDMPS